MDEIAITGMGILSSNAVDVVDFNEALIKGTSNFSVSSEREENSIVGAFIKGFQLETHLEKYHSICPEVYKRAKRYLKNTELAMQTTAIACIEAWVNAGLYSDCFNKEQIGIVVAGSNLSQVMNYRMALKSLSVNSTILPSYALHYFDTNFVGVLSDMLQIQGEGFSVGGACASGNVAIINACRMLKEKRINI
ncbi:MAG: hypothetical protein GX319_00405 [Clostridiales bacterium]|jgi:malonyl-ACP decarboxylase|nr:hypothetical protein [Clostridiales bacterium]